MACVVSSICLAALGMQGGGVLAVLGRGPGGLAVSGRQRGSVCAWPNGSDSTPRGILPEGVHLLMGPQPPGLRQQVALGKGQGGVGR